MSTQHLPPGIRRVDNPPNPFASTDVEYLDEIMGDDGPERGAPVARLQVLEDATRTIVASNDSPDVGFKWSVNPYRGCQHACAYCLDGDTPILMADGRTRPLRDVRTGDEVVGTELRGAYRRYVRSTVLARWRTVKPAHRVRLSDGTSLVASADHRFLTHRGWKFVTGRDCGADRRPHLTANDLLVGTGAFTACPAESDDYRTGYLAGMVRRDGHLRSYRYERPGRAHGDPHRFRLALVDLEPLQRVRRYLDAAEVETHSFLFAEARANRRAAHAIRTSSRRSVERIGDIVAWPEAPSAEWHRGFLGGIFDAEGSWSGGVLRISNTDPAMLARTGAALDHLGFDHVLEDRSAAGAASSVRVRGGLREHVRFMHLVDPAITRKRRVEGQALKCPTPLRVESVEALGFDMLMFDITTTTSDFIADGVVSHNCYARPGHEYLSLGAGTDFDRIIVVKPDAPRLLREHFDKPSWKGEFLMFSGVTDCYQPLEASYRVTRGCLEVCAEYRNPCGVITKAPLAERDLDVFEELTRVTDFSITMSIPFWDPARARAIEPYVATPQRRMRTVEALAKRGISVGVNVAPLIPGLGDEDVPAILKAAADAGARRANFVYLRLPGPVAQVFAERVRAALPLRAEKILSRIREARGGKLYDARFGARQVGEGPYAEAAMRLFEATARKHGLATGCPSKDAGTARDTFRRPPKSGDQLGLFGDLPRTR